MRMNKVMAFVVAAAFMLFFGAHLAWCGNPQGNYPKAPDFKVTDINGKSISLSAYKGKVLFVNFWATWCGPCRAEIPGFVEVYGQQKAKGLEILGISLDSIGKDAIVAFIKKFKINYPVVLETKETTEKILDDYQPGQFIPATIVIDKQGRIRDKKVGTMDKETLLRYFQQLAAE
jgi:peroxiredoxin